MAQGFLGAVLSFQCVDLFGGFFARALEFVDFAQSGRGVVQAGGEIHGFADLFVQADDFGAQLLGWVVGVGLLARVGGEGFDEFVAVHVARDFFDYGFVDVVGQHVFVFSVGVDVAVVGLFALSVAPPFAALG
ncbi:MAG: hypothetical protein PF501_07640 [Salinisphaera sp.]|nr:hypothetical protein [Salinisphaera sp.]